jgi:hypothetical protein
VFSTKIVAPYDNAAGFSTGVAVANPSSNSITVIATISDQDGSQLGAQNISLAPNSHTAFFFTEQFPVTAGREGIVTFQSSGSPGLAALGLRFSPFGTFTSVPVAPLP